MTDTLLAVTQPADTEEERIWVVETLLKRQIAVMQQEPVSAITHDIQLNLIGENGDAIKISRFDVMSKLFADMKVANIRIAHVCMANPDCLVDNGVGDDIPDVEANAFTLSEALGWFAQEISEYDDREKVAQCQALGMLLVFMVRKSFMSDFEGGVELAHHFLKIIKHFPGLNAVGEIFALGQAVSNTSSVDIGRDIFLYLCGQGGMPSHEIAVVLLEGDFVINGLDSAMELFEDEEAHEKLKVSCHFIPYLPDLSTPKGVIRLSDLIAIIAAQWPESEQPVPVVTDNLMGLLYHVINSNAKSTPCITGEELVSMVKDCQRIMRARTRHLH